MCAQCNNSVAASERRLLNGKVYHATCLETHDASCLPSATSTSIDNVTGDSEVNANYDKCESEQRVSDEDAEAAATPRPSTPLGGDDVNGNEIKTDESTANSVNNNATSSAQIDNESLDALGEVTLDNAEFSQCETDVAEVRQEKEEREEQVNITEEKESMQTNEVKSQMETVEQVHDKHDDNDDEAVKGDIESSECASDASSCDKMSKSAVISDSDDGVVSAPVKPKKFYPTDLNPFGEEEEAEDEETEQRAEQQTDILKKKFYPGDLNPFGEDEEETSNVASCATNYDDSLNPFGDEDEDNADEKSATQQLPTPTPRSLRNLNPAVKSPSQSPIPSRKLLSSHNSHSTASLDRSRNRPPHPPPPLPKNGPVLKPSPTTLSLESADASSPSDLGPRSSTPQPRPSRPLKKKAAPKPPSPSVPPNDRSVNATKDCLSLNTSFASVEASPNVSAVSSVPGSPASARVGSRRVSLTPSVGSVRSDLDSDASHSIGNSSTLKKKRQAPAPPQATRREVFGSLDTIQAELNDIGDRLAEIQIHVVHLEDEFKANNGEQSELIYNYLEFAKETCSLARKQEELMYQ